MGMLKIHCGYCGQTWEVYARSDYHRHAIRTCPHCDSKIDGQTWEKQILPAFLSMCDANRELVKDHTGYGQPMFTVDFIEDRIFPNAATEVQAELVNLSGRIDELAEAISDITLYQ